MAENINYKEVLDDKFIDTEDLKVTQESNEYLTEFNSQIKGSNIDKLGKINKYYDKNRPGAKSPISVEAAQDLVGRVTENIINALRAEIARAISSELRLSSFMKDNMVTKSEDQTISGDKEFTGHTVVRDLATTRLNIPQGAPSNPQAGDIWYE